MKIISNFKDYYDYVGGNDPDSKKVYVRKTVEWKNGGEFQRKDLPEEMTHDRRIFVVPKSRRGTSVPSDIYGMGYLYFCDRTIPVIVERVSGTDTYHYSLKGLPPDFVHTYELRRFIWGRGRKGSWEDFFSKIVEVKLNKLSGCPVIWYYQGIVLNPRLSDISFNHYLSPTQCFTEIYNWLPYEGEVELPMGGPDDMIRWEQKGFDKKTSFRNVK